MCEKWTQHPPEHNGASGGEETLLQRTFSNGLRRVSMQSSIAVFDLTDPKLSHEARNKSEMNFDSQRLTAFLRSASQVVSSLNTY